MWTPPQPGPGQAPMTLPDAKAALPSPPFINLNNMSTSSLTEALLLLSGMYISLVQPEPGPIKVGLHAIFPRTTASFRNAITEPFTGRNKHVTLSNYRLVPTLFDISASYSRSEYSPKELLEVLCEQIFPQNTITIFYLNNHLGLQRYSPSTVSYLPQMLQSLGLPIISYDTQFSPNSRSIDAHLYITPRKPRQPALTLQLAPTMGQMIDVLFAFLKMFSWSDFSFLCTLSYGCLDEIASIRVKVDEFQRKQNSSIYGVDTFSFRLLSYVNFTDGKDRTEVVEKLKYELHKDSRINLVHGNGAEVKTIMDVAKDVGLTGQEYVWIFTAASISISEENPTVDPSYPLGSFIIGFNSSRDDMETVVKMGVSLWLQALDSLATSSQLESVDFKTGFSCSRRRDGSGQTVSNTTSSPWFWKYGHILYKHMLKPTLPGGLLFDEFGVLKTNKFWIKNVQSHSSRFYSNDDYTRKSSRWQQDSVSLHSGAHHSGHASVLDHSSAAEVHTWTSSKVVGHHSAFISHKKNDWSPNTNNDDRRVAYKMSYFTDKDYRLADQMSGFTDNDPEMLSQRGSVLPYKRNPRLSRSAKLQRKVSAPTDAGSNARFPSPKYPVENKRQVLQTRRLGRRQFKDFHLSSNVIMRNTTDYSLIDHSLSLHPSGNDGFHITKSAESAASVSHRHLERRNQWMNFTVKLLPNSSSKFDARRGHRVITVGLKHSSSGHSDIAGMKRHAETAGLQEEMSEPPSRQSDQRSKRAARKQFAKKVAEWNGHNLSMAGIVWPAGKSTPPKGKPEKYVLRVVTWREAPHVIYSEKINSTGEASDTCNPNSVPCKVYLRNKQLHRLNETKEMCCMGLCIDLLMRLSEMLHFQIDLSEVPDGGYGSPLNKNFTDWNGMLGMLIHDKADMAIGALSITPERAAAVDFSVPFLQTGISIIVAIRDGVISPTAFLEPYDYPSWGLILVLSVHATGASIFIFEWLSPYGLNQGKTSFSVHKFSLFRSFWLIWSMLFGASVTTDQPRGIASRFLANIWALFAVVFCASYTANLAAFMITKDDFYDLSGIQDWRLKNPHHRHPPFKFATIANSSTDVNIGKNYKEIHRYMKTEAQTDVKDAIQNLKKGYIQAFIYDSTTLEYEVGKDDFCKLKTVGKRIAETGYGVAFSRRSQWVQEVNKAILQLQEDGAIERLQKFWLAGACHKKKEPGVSSHTLGILNFTSAFILLGTGVILACVLLILEHIYFRFGRKSLKTCDKHGCCSLVSLSIGQSLTFEQSVMEAMDYQRHYKCKHPLCQTQLWKVRHDLDIALLKISQLRKQIAYSATVEAAKRRDSLSLTRKDLDMKLYQNGTIKKRRQQANDYSTAIMGQSVRRPLLAVQVQADANNEDILQPSSGDTVVELSPIIFPAIQNVSVAQGSIIALPDVHHPICKQQSAGETSLISSNWCMIEAKDTGSRNTTPSDHRQVVGPDYCPSPAYFHEVLAEYVFPAEPIINTPSSAGSPTDLLTTKSPLLPHTHGEILLPFASMTSNVFSSMNGDASVTCVRSQSPSLVLPSEESQKPLSNTFSKFCRENPSIVTYQSTGMSLTESSLMSELQADDSDVLAVGNSHNYNHMQTSCPSGSTHSRLAVLNHLQSNTNQSECSHGDVSVRDTTTKSINIYVNPDEVIGKETSF